MVFTILDSPSLKKKKKVVQTYVNCSENLLYQVRLCYILVLHPVAVCVPIELSRVQFCIWWSIVFAYTNSVGHVLHAEHLIKMGSSTIHGMYYMSVTNSNGHLYETQF